MIKEAAKSHHRSASSITKQLKNEGISIGNAKVIEILRRRRLVRRDQGEERERGIQTEERASQAMREASSAGVGRQGPVWHTREWFVRQSGSAALQGAWLKKGLLLFLKLFVDVVKPQVVVFHNRVHASVFKALHQDQGLM